MHGWRLTQHTMEVRHTQLYSSTCFTHVTACAELGLKTLIIAVTLTHEQTLVKAWHAVHAVQDAKILAR